MRWKYSVGEIIRQYWQEIFDSPQFNTHQIRHLYKISLCRTAALGGHVLACDECGHFHISYNSCGNRHCPTCQSLKREEWIARQEAVLLPVTYFHLVFTLPHDLNGLCMAYPRLLYSLLYKCAWETTKAFAADPKYLGAKTGTTMVLHTLAPLQIIV